MQYLVFAAGYDTFGIRNADQTLSIFELGEQMKAKYALREISKLLESTGFHVKVELSSDEMTAKYFSDYNNANPDRRIEAPVGVRYLLASRTNPDKK